MRQILAKRGANSKFVVEANHKPLVSKFNQSLILLFQIRASVRPCLMVSIKHEPQIVKAEFWSSNSNFIRSKF